MTTDEFEKGKQKIKANFAQRRLRLSWEEDDALNNFKLINCEIKLGDFVQYGGKTYKVLKVSIEDIKKNYVEKLDVCAHLERVKKDKTPTVKPEFEIAIIDFLKVI